MYAIIQTGGKQYQIEKGVKIKVEKLNTPIGEEVLLDDVRMVYRDDGRIILGDQLKETKVLAQVIEQRLDPKITIIKFKRRKHYRKKIGHRQRHTLLLIKEIEG